MEKLKRILNKGYLFYLGALPALATFFLIQNLEEGAGGKARFLMFIIGTIIVSVYLAMIISYLKPINNIRRLILIIIDGPLFALIGSLNHIDIPTIIITTFFIENIAIWISIGILSNKSSIADKAQKIGSIILALVSIGGMISICYITGFFDKTRYRYIIIFGGLIESIGITYKILEEDNAGEDNMGFLLGFLFLRIAVLFIGTGIHG